MVVQAVGGLVQVLISALGNLTVALIHILLMVAGYNGYMDSPAITTGWVIVRDLANLFFVAIILIVSIGSIVNPERFGGVKKVFRVLLYALLVNFSRTIAGLFIDISQLVMLTFVNGFAQAAGGNFVEALGITKLTNITPGTTPIDFSSAMAGLLLGLLMFILITVIIAVMVVALVVRMVTLWMLVVLSPLAFALGSSDLTKQHYAEWWKKFAAELTTGPIVAFFLWLSLVTFQSTSGSAIVGPAGLKDNAAGSGETTGVTINAGDVEAYSQENLIRFVVATVMLLAGLGFAKEFSGLGGSLAGAAMSKGKQYARGAVSYVGKQSWAGAKTVGGIAAAPVTVPLARVGDGYNRLKGRAGRALGTFSRPDRSWFTRNIVGTFTRPASIAMTGSVGKRDAEADKKAREALQYASPEALSGVITNALTTDAEKRAASMKIIKDREYVGARRDDQDVLVRGRAEIFERAAEHLRGIQPGIDKDLDDIVKDGREKRPDAFYNPHDPRGRSQDQQIREAGAGLSRDEFFKLNINGMTDHDLQTLVGGIRPQVMEAIMERATGRQMDRLHQLVLPAGANAPRIDQAIDQEGIDWARVRVDAPAPPPPAGTPPPPPGTPPPPPIVNLLIGERQLMHGTPETRAQYRRNTERERIVEAHANDLRPRVGWDGTGPASGFNAAGQLHERLSDANLRRAEALVMAGGSLKQAYTMTERGGFGENTGKARRSFAESLNSSPARIEIALSLDASQMAPGTDAMRTVYENIGDPRHAADMVNVPRIARETGREEAFQQMVRSMHAIATAEAAATGNRTRLNAIEFNSEWRSMLPT